MNWYIYIGLYLLCGSLYGFYQLYTNGDKLFSLWFDSNIVLWSIMDMLFWFALPAFIILDWTYLPSNINRR